MLAINQMKGNNMGFSVTFDNKNIDEKKWQSNLTRKLRNLIKLLIIPLKLETFG